MTNMAVSCPVCGVENTVSMEVMEAANNISDMISMIIPGIKQYTFHGETKCICGEIIHALLTVGNGKNKKSFL